LLEEGSEAYRVYREGVRKEIEEWHRREGGAGVGKGRRKGRAWMVGWVWLDGFEGLLGKWSRMHDDANDSRNPLCMNNSEQKWIQNDTSIRVFVVLSFW
jgi:hypothetical protein